MYNMGVNCIIWWLPVIGISWCSVVNVDFRHRLSGEFVPIAIVWIFSFAAPPERSALPIWAPLLQCRVLKAPAWRILFQRPWPMTFGFLVVSSLPISITGWICDVRAYGK
jgi:hypothetical protein